MAARRIFSVSLTASQELSTPSGRNRPGRDEADTGEHQKPAATEQALKRITLAHRRKRGSKGNGCGGLMVSQAKSAWRGLIR